MPEAKVLDELYIQRVEKRDTLQKGQQPRTAAAVACRRPTGPQARLLGQRLSADSADFRLFRQFVTTS